MLKSSTGSSKRHRFPANYSRHGGRARIRSAMAIADWPFRNHQAKHGGSPQEPAAILAGVLLAATGRRMLVRLGTNVSPLLPKRRLLPMAFLAGRAIRFIAAGRS